MEIKSQEEISLFVRDEETCRILFNARALLVLGIDPVLAKQRGYPLKEAADMAVAAPSANAA
jgi:hypothetical protein